MLWMIDFSSFYSFSNQKSHYTSHFFFTRFHDWYWTNTRTSNLTCSTYNDSCVRGRCNCALASNNQISVQQSKSSFTKHARYENPTFQLTAPHTYPTFIGIPLLVVYSVGLCLKTDQLLLPKNSLSEICPEILYRIAWYEESSQQTPKSWVRMLDWAFFHLLGKITTHVKGELWKHKFWKWTELLYTLSL